MSSIYYGMNYVGGRHRRRNMLLARETKASRRHHTAALLGRSALRTSLQSTLRRSLSWLNRYREGVATTAGILSAAVGAYYACRGLADYQITDTMRQAAETFVTGGSEKPAAAGRTNAGSEICYSALAGGASGLAFLARLAFGAERQEVVRQAPAEARLEARIAPARESFLPGFRHHEDQPVSLAEVHNLNLAPTAGRIYRARALSLAA